MDPLSISASVAGLITITDVIVRRGYKFIHDAKGADKAVTTLITEVNNLSGTLYSLRNVVQRFESEMVTIEPVSQVRHIETCYQTLQKIQTTLEQANPSSSDSSMGSLRRKLKWPLSGAETKELVIEVERHASTLHLALSADGMSALLLALARQDTMQAAVSDIKRGLDRDRAQRKMIMLSEERDKILKSLGNVDPARYQFTNCQLRQPGTGMWFIGSQEFKGWLKEPGSKLWLHGIPGAGKTVLTSLIVQEIQRIAGNDNGFAFYYCDYKDAESQNPANILGSLVKQLAMQDEECFALLEVYWKERKPSSVDKNLDDLTNLLSAMASKFSDTFIVVDALDEVSKDRSSILNQIKSLVARGNNIKILLTSRREVDIEQTLYEFTEVSIAAQSSDVRLYVASEIENRIRQKRLWLRDPGLKEHILTELAAKADGMFRWVACQMDYLCELNNDRARRKALNELPPDLPQTYDRILQRVNESNESNKALVKKTLRWILGAQGGLTTDALLEALAIEPGDTSLNEDAITTENDIFRWCSCLIRQSEDMQGLELAHFSVKEYLLGIKGDPSSPLRDFAFDPVNTQIELAIICLTCLNFNPPGSETLPKMDTDDDIDDFVASNQFFVYATEYWPDHSRASLHDVRILDLAFRLYESHRSYRFLKYTSSFFMTLGPDAHRHDGRQEMVSKSGSFSPLALASALSLKELCSKLIESGADVNYQGYIGSPLGLSMCPLAIEDAQNRRAETFGRTGFRHFMPPPSLVSSAADRAGERNIAVKRTVQCLLAAGAKFLPFSDNEMFRDNPEGVLQFLKLTDEDPDIVSRIIEAGLTLSVLDVADINQQLSLIPRVPGNWRLLFQLAKDDTVENQARQSFAAIAMAITNNSVTRSAKPLILRSALSEKTLVESCLKSAKYGQCENLMSTLEALKPMMGSEKYVEICWKAFMEGSLVGHASIVEALLSSDIDMNRVDHHEETPLHFVLSAAFETCNTSKHYEIVEAVLNKGADPLRANVDGELPLHHAAMGFGPDIIRLLLRAQDSAAQSMCLKTKTKDGRSPLWCAIGRGRDASVFYLLEIDADLDLSYHKKEGISCLHLATQRSSPAVLARLLEVGADINERDTKGETPLHHATGSRGYLSCFIFLIQKGADISAIAKSGWGATQIVLDEPNDDCPEKLKILLDAGVDINASPGPALSPLYLVLTSSIFNDISLIQLKTILEQPGVQINLQGEEGFSPVMECCIGFSKKQGSVVNDCKLEALKLLLKAGADVRLRDSKDRTAMHYLCMEYPTLDSFDGISLLFEAGADFHTKSSKGATPFEYLLSLCNRAPGRLPVRPNEAPQMREKPQGLAPIIEDTEEEVGDEEPQDQPDIRPEASESEASEEFEDPEAASTAFWEDWGAIVSYALDRMTAKQLEEHLSYGLQPLSWAIGRRDHWLTRRILGKVSSVEKTDEDEELGCNPILMACIYGCNAKTADQLVTKYKQDLNQLLFNRFLRHGTSLLHLAASYEDGIQMVRRLINAKVNLEDPNEKGKTALMKAAGYLYGLQTVNILLKAGANVNTKHTIKGYTALRVAAASGSTDIVKRLIEVGATLEDINKHDECTPLVTAAVRAKWEAAKVLINAGANVSAVNPFHGGTIFHIAAANESTETLDLVLARNPTFDLEHKDKWGRTALLMSIEYGKFSTFNNLLKKGAKVKASCVFGNAAHMSMALKSNIIRDILLTHDIDWINTESNGELGNDIHDNADDKAPEVEEVVVAKKKGLAPPGPTRPEGSVAGNQGCNPFKDTLSLSGSVPLHMAAKFGNTTAIRFLADHNLIPDINVKTSLGITPLHLAARFSYTKLAKLLIELGADVNATTHTGETPLHFAALSDAVDIATLLIENTCDLNKENTKKDTALHWARREESRGVQRILKHRQKRGTGDDYPALSTPTQTSTAGWLAGVNSPPKISISTFREGMDFFNDSPVSHMNEPYRELRRGQVLVVIDKLKVPLESIPHINTLEDLGAITAGNTRRIFPQRPLSRGSDWSGSEGGGISTYRGVAPIRRNSISEIATLDRRLPREWERRRRSQSLDSWLVLNGVAGRCSQKDKL